MGSDEATRAWALTCEEPPKIEQVQLVTSTGEDLHLDRPGDGEILLVGEQTASRAVLAGMQAQGHLIAGPQQCAGPAAPSENGW